MQERSCAGWVAGEVPFQKSVAGWQGSAVGMAARLPVARVYRTLQRAAAALDDRPALFALLRLRSGTGEEVPMLPAGAPVAVVGWQQATNAICDGREYWRPGSGKPGAAAAAVRRAFRDAARGGGEAGGVPPPAQALDAALTAVTALSLIIQAVQRGEAAGSDVAAWAAAGGSGATGCPRLPPDSPFLPRLRGADPAAPVAPGVVLAEHPSVIGPGRGLHLVWDISRNVQQVHGDERWMLRSYCLNRPVHASVAAFTKRDDLGALGALPLFYGGRSDAHLAIVHSFADVPGAAPINEEAGCPLHIGGDLAAINARLPSAPPDAVKVVLGSHQVPLVVGEGGQDDISLPDDDRWMTVGGAAAWDAAMLAPLQPPDALAQGSPAAVMWHQHVAWSAAVHALASAETGAVATALRDWAALPPQVFASTAQLLAQAVRPVTLFGGA